MVSLKKYSKNQILNECKARFKKIASLLDDEDYEDMLEQTLSWLDEAVFSPREILFKPEHIMEYKGGNFVDVTPYKIDVINRVYFQDTFDNTMNTILPEVGLMPFIVGAQNFTSLSSIGEYLALKSNINSMYRQLDSDGDFELWPRDEKGRQLLQLRRNIMTRIEYLPSIDRDADEWYFYDFEYAALKDVLFDKCNLFNAEMQMSATALGVAKEISSVVSYWEKKLENDQKSFLDKAMITALY